MRSLNIVLAPFAVCAILASAIFPTPYTDAMETYSDNESAQVIETDNTTIWSLYHNPSIIVRESTDFGNSLGVLPGAALMIACSPVIAICTKDSKLYEAYPLLASVYFFEAVMGGAAWVFFGWW